MAQRAESAIDRLTDQERRENMDPLKRLIAAHNAMVKYVDEEMA